MNYLPQLSRLLALLSKQLKEKNLLLFSLS